MMNRLDIVIVAAPVVRLIIEEYITKFVPDTCIVIKEVEAVNYEKIEKHEIGFVLDSFAETVLRDAEGAANTIIITRHPLATGRRINYLPKSSEFFGSAVITVKELNGEGVEGKIAPLIYYTILQHIAGNKQDVAHSSKCIGSSMQGYEMVASHKLCDACVLPDDVLKETYESEMRRLYDLIHHYSRRHHVVLVHGIRTFGGWALDVSRYLETTGFNVKIEGYNRFSTAKLLGYWFYDTGKRERKKLKEALVQLKKQSPHSKTTVIAHSHGSLLISKLLEEKQIEIDNLILCGSIVRRDFPWGDLVQNGIIKQVLNIAGRKDIWAAIAENWVYGAGGSGLLGFQSESENVRTLVRADGGHSTSLNDSKHQKKIWLPFMERGYLPTPEDKSFSKPQSTTFAQLLSDYFSPKYLLICTLIYVCYRFFTS